MARFAEDDEIEEMRNEKAQADAGYDMMKRDMQSNRVYSERLASKIEEATIDPVVKRLAATAEDKGQLRGANEALGKRIYFLEQRIKVRDTEIDRLTAENKSHADYDAWVESSQEWERLYKGLKNYRKGRN